MPLYVYQCSCGLQFEGAAHMKENKKPKACPSCGALAPRMMPTDISGTYNQDVSSPVPQNTGLSQLDAHIDRVIGQSAQKGWEVADLRAQEKREILAKEPEITGRDLSRNPDGSYRVMAPSEKEVHDRALAIHTLAIESRKKTS